MDGKIKCMECGHEAHFLQPHLEEDCIGVDEYAQKYAGQPLMSGLASSKLESFSGVLYDSSSLANFLRSSVLQEHILPSV